VTENRPPATTTRRRLSRSRATSFSLTVGPEGTVVLQDHYLIEQMANFNRERIVERQPHAKGRWARFGHFEVTGDRQRLHQGGGVPARHPDRDADPVLHRGGGSGAAPTTWRDPRGFALKFYTSEGNYDMVGEQPPRCSSCATP